MHAGLCRDALRQARVRDVFKKDRGDLVLLDRVDDTGNVARARFRFGRDALGCDEFETVARRKIAEGVMGRYDASALLGKPRDRARNLLVQRGEFRGVVRRVGPIGFGLGGVFGDQSVANACDLELCICHVLPSVRISTLLVTPRRHGFADRHDRRLGL